MPDRKNRLLQPTRSLVCGTVLALSATLAAAPAGQSATAQNTGNPVLLPTDGGHTLSGGPSGWVSTAQVTATGCGTSGSCPVAAGVWDGTSSTDGELRSSLTGSAGHSGVASVTWRSPLFVVPADASDAAFTLSAESDFAFTAAPGLVPTYSVHLIDAGTGTVRTVVDSNPVPTPDAGLAPLPAVALPAGTLVPGSVQRLEIVTTFPISARAGDATVAFADPTLVVDQLEPATSLPGLTTPTLLTPTSPTTPVVRVVPQATPSPDPSDVGDDQTPATDDPADACDTDDIAVIGAAGTGRTLSILGTAEVTPGSPVDLLSTDGWLLGHTTVDGRGRFAATLAEPAGSAGTRKLFARLSDGRRSPQVAVQRRNVLRVVRPTARGLVVTGTVAPAIARTGRLALDVALSTAGSCQPTGALHTTGLRVDRRTGAYRALVPSAALGNALRDGAEAASTEPVLVRADVTQSGPGRARLVTRSQVIFGAVSDRRGT